ncbi:MAG: glutathione peroxidase, partial [Bacteroidota bacterium]|nr:glutathione peroxidase [Bacteroidota bacterium]
PTSFYDLRATAINGSEIDFNTFKGKNVFIVNTASDCGYTNQLSDLKKLNQLYTKELVVLGFPSNDFKEQEKLSDKEIESFCIVNFGVDFPLTQKCVVIKDKRQHDVFKWLSDRDKNGWNEKAPEWNFAKYLINRKGILTHYFGPGVEPLSNDITGSFH